MERIKHICIFLTILILCSCTNNKKDDGNLSANAVGTANYDTAPSNSEKISAINDNDGTTDPFEFDKDSERLRLLFNDSITDISPLSSFKKLKELKLEGLDNLTDISPLGTLTNLEKLDITACENIKNTEPLSSLVNLKYLRLDHMGGHFKELIPLEKLEVLILYCYDQGADVSPIGQLHNLKELNIWNGFDYPPEKNVINLDKLKNLVNLEKLTIYYVNNIDLSWIPDLKNLQELIIYYCTVDDVNPLLELPNLTRVDFNHTKVKDIAPLAESKSIKVISSPILENKFSGLYDLFREKGIKYVPYTEDR
jgi:Leucine-rich repeat (LRR) protein